MEELDKIVQECRDKLFDYIKEKLSQSKDHKINFITPLVIPCDIDEDRYYNTIITGLYLYQDDIVVVVDVDGLEDEDDIATYSFDELYLMAKMLTI